MHGVGPISVGCCQRRCDPQLNAQGEGWHWSTARGLKSPLAASCVWGTVLAGDRNLRPCCVCVCVLLLFDQLTGPCPCRLCADVYVTACSAGVAPVGRPQVGRSVAALLHHTAPIRHPFPECVSPTFQYTLPSLESYVSPALPCVLSHCSFLPCAAQQGCECMLECGRDWALLPAAAAGMPASRLPRPRVYSCMHCCCPGSAGASKGPDTCSQPLLVYQPWLFSWAVSACLGLLLLC